MSISEKPETNVKPYRLFQGGCSFSQEKMMWFFLLFLLLSTYPYILEAADVRLANDQAVGIAAANTSVIGSGAMSNLSGLVRVNLTAGDGNVQQNSAALAQVSGGPSVALVKARQSANDLPQDFYQVLSAQIRDGAFQNALGVVMVNQSSGVGNAQFNGAAIAIGGVGSAAIIQLDDSRLDAFSADTGLGGAQDENGPSLVEASASLSPDSFQNAKGIIMINQAAGNNNVAANSFTLSVAQ